MPYLIRKFKASDREAVRCLSCQTAFLELPPHLVFDDDEVLADFLTLYFTDYEPDSCFVAVANSSVIGYLIGSRDVGLMNRIIKKKIIPLLFKKVLLRKTFFNRINLRFLFFCLLSFLRGEFFIPNFSKEFPATLHINIDKRYRNQGIGRELIDNYLDYLKHYQIKGVHFSSFSEQAKIFFLKLGFEVLITKRRSYLEPFVKREVKLYVFGKKI